MFNERRPKCTKEKTGGAMAVYLASFQPIPEVTSDFGEVALIIAGLGECGRSYQTSTRAYVKGLIEESTDLLVSTLHTKVE